MERGLNNVRAAKNLRNANLNLASKIEIFWSFNLKKPQITDLEKPQRMNPQPQKGWPHPRLKFWGFLRIALKPKFLRILEKPRILSYFWAIFKGFFTNFRGFSRILRKPQKSWPHPHLKFWGLLRLKPHKPHSSNITLILKKPQMFLKRWSSASKNLSFWGWGWGSSEFEVWFGHPS